MTPLRPGPGPSAESQTRTQPLRVLIADDDRDSALTLSTLLEIEGFEVRTVHGGQEALDAAREFRPDVVLLAQSGEDALRLVLKHEFAAILLDVRLPGMDGYEVAAAIRTLERTRRTPIIFMSAEDDRRTALRDGAAETYLRKPLEPDVLLPTLAHLLGSNRA